MSVLRTAGLLASMILAATVVGGSTTDFTVRGTSDDPVDLPERLTDGTWFYTVTYQTDADDAPAFYLKSVDLSCNDSTTEKLAASARSKRLTVGAYPADICAGWHEIDPIDYQLGSWSVRFVKEGADDEDDQDDSCPDPELCPECEDCEECPEREIGDGSLQNGQFVVTFGGLTPDERQWVATIGDWPSDKGILYWAFDDQNPEGLFKVLDGRSFNDHWWMDLAVTSDLRTLLLARHTFTGATWQVFTGRAKDFGITDPDVLNDLIHCASPSDRSDDRCAIIGFGTTVSLRDAWTNRGLIPSKYYGSPQSSTGTLAAPALRSAVAPAWGKIERRLEAGDGEL